VKSPPPRSRRLDLLAQLPPTVAQRNVAFGALGWYREILQKASAPKSRQRSENTVLDQAILQLLGATKEEAKKKGKPVDRAQLQKEGYSERFIDKVENA
jgi:hypothetical protein